MTEQFFEDIAEGHVEESDEFIADRTEMITYAAANDPWPIHMDEAFATETVFGDITASFGYVVSLFFRAVHTLPVNRDSRRDAFLGALEWERVRFRKAVLPDDRLRVRMTIVSKQLGRKGDRGTVKSSWEIVNQDDEVVVALEMVALYRTRGGGAQPGDHT